MALEAVEGQPRVVELLRRALASDRLAHAYAFVGPPGSGRTAAAVAFARALVCPHGDCGRCRACALVASGQHPDVHVIAPTPPETNPRGARAIRISAIRELQRRASLKPVMGACKVLIVDDADRMTGEAPEAFLKTLEEPPDRTVIVLVLERPRAVPATVLSRCQLVRFQARTDERGAEERAEAEALLDEVRARGVEALFRRSQIFDRDRERAERFVDAYWLYCRDLLLAGSGIESAPPGARGEDLRAEARSWTLEGILCAIEMCRQARRALAVNVTPRLTVEVLVDRLARRAA